MERRVFFHPSFQKEWKEILDDYKQYKRKLETNLAQLIKKCVKFGENVITEPYFGQLSSSENLYKMVVTKKKPNVRVVFAIVKKQNREIVALLTVFYEKEKSDYKQAIKRARQRLEDTLFFIGEGEL